jgi:hypothetical protein
MAETFPRPAAEVDEAPQETPVEEQPNRPKFALEDEAGFRLGPGL